MTALQNSVRARIAVVTGGAGRPGFQEIQDHHPERTGLTADQAAAVLPVLTDGNLVTLLAIARYT